MSNVIQFRKRESDDTDIEPIDTIFTNLLLDLEQHGYWEPSEENYSDEHMCLMFESILSYMNSVDDEQHPLQGFAEAVDNNHIRLDIESDK